MSSGRSCIQRGRPDSYLRPGRLPAGPLYCEIHVLNQVQMRYPLGQKEVTLKTRNSLTPAVSIERVVPVSGGVVWRLSMKEVLQNGWEVSSEPGAIQLMYCIVLNGFND